MSASEGETFEEEENAIEFIAQAGGIGVSTNSSGPVTVSHYQRHYETGTFSIFLK
jgi:hypothetical protein